MCAPAWKPGILNKAAEVEEVRSALGKGARPAGGITVLLQMRTMQVSPRNFFIDWSRWFLKAWRSTLWNFENKVHERRSSESDQREVLRQLTLKREE